MESLRRARRKRNPKQPHEFKRAPLSALVGPVCAGLYVAGDVPANLDSSAVLRLLKGGAQ